MKYKNCQEILEHKEIMLEEKINLENTVKELKKNKRIFNAKENKIYFNNLMKNYLEKINNLNIQLGECNNLLDSYTTYPVNMLIPFLTKIISSIEEDNYVDTRLVISESLHFPEVYIPKYSQYYLIFNGSYSDEETKLEKTFLISSHLHTYRQLLRDSKFILAKSCNSESLLFNGELKSCFYHFPYLLEIAFNLIDRRIAEPEKHLQEILNDEIENIKSIGQKKLKVEENN